MPPSTRKSMVVIGGSQGIGRSGDKTVNGVLKAPGRADGLKGRAMKIKLVLAIITIRYINISKPGPSD
jgi:hypothetical protein